MLSTGIVVDDAIVVLENIYSKIEEGMSPHEAGHKGSNEIYFAIISTTITLASVFLPIIFLQGLTGRLFREFGIVVAGSVLISAFVSLDAHPDDERPHPAQDQAHENKLLPDERTASSTASGRTISGRWGCSSDDAGWRWWSWPASLALILGVGAMIPSELAPMEDKSRLVVNATAPEGTVLRGDAALHRA